MSDINYNRNRAVGAGLAGPAAAGVTGNPIRAYTDPDGWDPLGESILRNGSAPGLILLAD